MRLPPTAPRSPSPDARRHARRRIELSARLACLDAERDPRTGESAFVLMPARTLDISDGGLALSAEEAVNCGRRVVLELDLPNGHTVEVAGRVVWLEPPATSEGVARMGVAFAEPRDDLSQWLE